MKVIELLDIGIRFELKLYSMPSQHTDVTNQNYVVIIGSSSFAGYKLKPLNNYFIILDKFDEGNSLLNATVKTKEKVEIFKGNK